MDPHSSTVQASFAQASLEDACHSPCARKRSPLDMQMSDVAVLQAGPIGATAGDAWSLLTRLTVSSAPTATRQKCSQCEHGSLVAQKRVICAACAFARSTCDKCSGNNAVLCAGACGEALCENCHGAAQLVNCPSRSRYCVDCHEAGGIGRHFRLCQACNTDRTIQLCRECGRTKHGDSSECRLCGSPVCGRECLATHGARSHCCTNCGDRAVSATVSCSDCGTRVCSTCSTSCQCCFLASTTERTSCADCHLKSHPRMRGSDCCKRCASLNHLESVEKKCHLCTPEARHRCNKVRTIVVACSVTSCVRWAGSRHVCCSHSHWSPRALVGAEPRLGRQCVSCWGTYCGRHADHVVSEVDQCRGCLGQELASRLIELRWPSHVPAVAASYL